MTRIPGGKFPHISKCYFQTSGALSDNGYDYSRLQNPTREELENTIANIENGKFGFAFSSGMAAVSTILSLFSPKDHIIVSDDLYGGTYRLFEEIYKNTVWNFPMSTQAGFRT